MLSNKTIIAVGYSLARIPKLCKEALPDSVTAGLLAVPTFCSIGVTVATTIANVVLVDRCPFGLVRTVSYVLLEVVVYGVVIVTAGVTIGVFAPAG